MSADAFCITVFAMDESFESRSKDLLAKAFALYPDKDPRVLPLPDAHSEIVNLWSKSICRPEAV